MHVAILGTGALGCVYAAKLAPHADVTVLGTWSEALAALALHGVRLTGPDGRQSRQPVAVLGSPDGVPSADVALVLVKSYQTTRAAEWAKRLLARDGVAVTLQNGLDNVDRLVATVGPGCVAVGVTYNAATLLGPGEVRHVAAQPTYIGPLGGCASGAARTRLERLVQLLNRSGLETHLDADVEGRLWGKAVANAAINPLTALLRVANGALLECEERLLLLRCLAREAADVAAARGIVLPFEDAALQAEVVCRATAANRSSMLQDVERGRRTEVDSINGVIAAEGRRLAVPTPHNELIWRLVRAI